MFNILFKKKPVANVAKEDANFFLSKDDAKSIGNGKNGKKTAGKNKDNKKVTSAKNQRSTPKKALTKSFFARKAQVTPQNSTVEVKEYWVDSDPNKFREMAKELIASRPTKFM